VSLHQLRPRKQLHTSGASMQSCLGQCDARSARRSRITHQPGDRRMLLVIRSPCKFGSLVHQDLAGCLVRWPLIAPPVLLRAVEGRNQLLPHGLRHAAVQVLGAELLDVRRASLLAPASPAVLMSRLSLHGLYKVIAGLST